MKIFLYEKLNGFLNKHLFKLLRPAYFIMGWWYGVWEILLRGLDAEAKSGSNALLMYNLVNIIKKLFSIKLKCCWKIFHMLLGMHALKAFGKYFTAIKNWLMWENPCFIQIISSNMDKCIVKNIKSSTAKLFFETEEKHCRPLQIFDLHMVICCRKNTIGKVYNWISSSNTWDTFFCVNEIYKKFCYFVAGNLVVCMLDDAWWNIL